MRISYAGDLALAVQFTQRAKQEFNMLQSRPGERGHFARVFHSANGDAMVWFTIGDGLDGIHIVAGNAAIRKGLPSWLSGAVISQGHMYAPTSNSIEKFHFASHPLVPSRISVAPHVSQPTRIEGGEADTQYTVQMASKYTGKMSKLVQLILGYGRLRSDTAMAVAISKFKDAEGNPLTYPPSVLWTPDNIKFGVQNTFGWEWARTDGVFTHTHMVGSTTVKDYWLINITPLGVKAMPLQIEPVTATPQFRAYIVDRIAAEGDDNPIHWVGERESYLRDILRVLDEFGGYPSNEAFLSKVTAIKSQIVTILPPEGLGIYAGTSSSVSPDHGWAFNDMGTLANTVCLEDHADGAWQMAHHCQINIWYDTLLNRPAASFLVIESGSAPLSKHVLKVGVTALDNCISYNLGLPNTGDYTGRPRADRTAMFVFWKRDRLEVLRWSDGLSKEDTNSVEETGDSWNLTRETWVGHTGTAPGFFCTLHDGRLPFTDWHETFRSTLNLANEHERAIGNSPATDTPEWWTRDFWAWREERTETTTGQRTDNCCAFIPIGERSAFYIATMVTAGRYEDDLQVHISLLGDPYAYSLGDTYIWNWDFGARYGWKFPVTYGGTTDDGIVDVIWSRSGGGGKCQLDWYGQAYIRAPDHYKGGNGYFNMTPEVQAALDEWTSRTGMGEWDSVGDEPKILLPQPYAGNSPVSYNHVTPARTTLSVYLVSLQGTRKVFVRSGSYTDIYHDYNYWFDRSPNENGDYQTMWAYKNSFGGQLYQLYSTDVNDSDLYAEGGYPLETSDFPTFIGVVGAIPA